MEKLFRLPEVKNLTGKSTTAVYRDMADGRFPRPVKIGERAVAWRQIDLENWLQACISECEAG